MNSFALWHDLPQLSSSEGMDLLLKSLSPLAITLLGMILIFVMGGLVCLLMQSLRLREMLRADSEFLDAYRLTEQPLELYLARRNHPSSPCWRTYESASRELCQHLAGAYTVNPELIARIRTAGRISPSQMEAIRKVMEHNALLWLTPLRTRIGRFTAQSLPSLGLIATLLIWLIESHQLQAFSFYPALSPLILALSLHVIFQGWRLHQESAIDAAKQRAIHLTAVWTRDVERHFVDHRKPIENLPSLNLMSVEHEKKELPEMGAIGKTVSES